MARNYYPLFEDNRILKREALLSLRMFGEELLQGKYKDFSDGIIFGFEPKVKGGDIQISEGLLKWKGYIFFSEQQEKIRYGHSQIEKALCFKMSSDAILRDYMRYDASLKIYDVKAIEEDTIEICRFKLKKGFILRDDYQDFYDIETEHDTVNLAEAKWAGPYGMNSISPFITRAFAREILKTDTDNFQDIQFAYMCLKGQEAIPREILIDYIMRRLGERYTSLNNKEIFSKLEKILRYIRNGAGAGLHNEKHRKKEILLT